ncbi:hypothetical protein ACMC56_02820 [Campylobacterota bacterium DY0563]
MKKITYLFSIFILSTILNAHTLLMNIMDNEDNTILVTGEFSTGEFAVGAMVRLESLLSGEVLYKKRLPDSSELIIEIPKEPYQIVLDGGPNHQIVKEGIAPIEGFSKEILKKDKKTNALSQPREVTKQWNNITIILFLLAFVLFLLTIYFSIINTNKILRSIKESH